MQKIKLRYVIKALNEIPVIKEMLKQKLKLKAHKARKYEKRCKAKIRYSKQTLLQFTGKLEKQFLHDNNPKSIE